VKTRAFFIRCLRLRRELSRTLVEGTNKKSGNRKSLPHSNHRKIVIKHNRTRIKQQKQPIPLFNNELEFTKQLLD
jgi:hypothetical protein